MPTKRIGKSSPMSNTLVKHTPDLDDTHTTYDRHLTRDESEVACVLHGMLEGVRFAEELQRELKIQYL